MSHRQGFISLPAMINDFIDCFAAYGLPVTVWPTVRARQYWLPVYMLFCCCHCATFLNLHDPNFVSPMHAQRVPYHESITCPSSNSWANWVGLVTEALAFSD